MDEIIDNEIDDNHLNNDDSTRKQKRIGGRKKDDIWNECIKEENGETYHCIHCNHHYGKWIKIERIRRHLRNCPKHKLAKTVYRNNILRKNNTMKESEKNLNNLCNNHLFDNEITNNVKIEDKKNEFQRILYSNNNIFANDIHEIKLKNNPSYETSGFKSHLSLEDIRASAHAFCQERDWEKFHTPRNLAMALVGEIGELCEIFQWRGEVAPGLPDWNEKDRTHLGEELSDVLIYLIRLADRCGIDLPSAVLRKLSINAAKYPVDLVKGSSKKYNEYNRENNKEKIEQYKDI